MGKHIIRDVTGKFCDINVLRLLYNLYDQYLDVRETNYLRDFSMLDTLETFNPKYIIRDVLEIYMRNVIDIFHKSDLLEKLTFTFRGEGEDVCKFEFCNNMMLRHDITTLCFLYHILYKRDFDECETVQILKSLMFNKYGICFKADDTESIQKQNKITLFDIAFSFPSITWGITCNLELWTKYFDLFSDFELPKIIFIPMIFPLLPQLKERPPLAILLFIVLRLNEFRGIKSLSLRTICNDISLFDMQTLFPERLKLELCKKWQIVTIEKDTYKYTPCFAAYRQKAKDIIAKMKSDDPDLEFILFNL